MSDVEIKLPNSEAKAARFSERRHPSSTEVIAAVTLVIQLCLIVWGAAKISAAVENLKTSMEVIQTDLRAINTSLQSLTTDVRVIQSEQKKP